MKILFLETFAFCPDLNEKMPACSDIQNYYGTLIPLVNINHTTIYSCITGTFLSICMWLYKLSTLDKLSICLLVLALQESN